MHGASTVRASGSTLVARRWRSWQELEQMLQDGDVLLGLSNFQQALGVAEHQNADRDARSQQAKRHHRFQRGETNGDC